MTRLGVGGGVAANNRLREKLGEMAAATAVELFIPPLRSAPTTRRWRASRCQNSRRGRSPASISTSPPERSAPRPLA